MKKEKLLSALKRLNEGKLERVYEQSIFFVPRTRAYLCEDCDTIGGSAKHCPQCESSALVNLSKLVGKVK